MSDDEWEYDDRPEGSTGAPQPGPRHVDKDVLRQQKKSKTYQDARKRFRDNGSRQRNPDGSTGAPCWLCNENIWYRLAWPHPLSWSLDHALTVKERPDLFLVEENWRHSHWGCNDARGTDDPPIDLGVPSEEW